MTADDAFSFECRDLLKDGSAGLAEGLADLTDGRLVAVDVLIVSQCGDDCDLAECEVS